MQRHLRPIDLARAVGLSAQSVRKYEELGFLPPAERSPTGRRRYTARHLGAIEAARVMQAGYRWEPALRIMQCLHRGDVPAALEIVDARHAELHEGRRQVEETLQALRDLLAGESTGIRLKTRETELLRVGEAARLAGVRVSTLRFWEQAGLLLPERASSNRYRLYDAEQIRRLRIVVLLRRAGYSPARIRGVLAELGSGNPQEALTAIERRRVELMEQSRRCAAATAAFWSYVQEIDPTGS